MSIKNKIEAIIYAAEEPVTLDQLAAILREAGLLESLLAGESTDASPETSRARPDPKAAEKAEHNALRARIRAVVDELAADYRSDERGMEVRQVAGGYRITTKPEHHDVVRAFARSLKPPIRLSLPALETLAVVAYKQPATAPEVSEIRGVDSTGVLATLLDRKLITTAGRKAVVGRPILYKTTKDFLLRFGLDDLSELPSMEEFEKMTLGPEQEELFAPAPLADATGVPDVEEETTQPDAKEPTPTTES